MFLHRSRLAAQEKSPDLEMVHTMVKAGRWILGAEDLVCLNLGIGARPAATDEGTRYMEEMRVGVIGAGSHAQAHFQMIDAEPAMRLIGVAELDLSLIHI